MTDIHLTFLVEYTLNETTRKQHKNAVRESNVTSERGVCEKSTGHVLDFHLVGETGEPEKFVKPSQTVLADQFSHSK